MMGRMTAGASSEGRNTSTPVDLTMNMKSVQKETESVLNTGCVGWKYLCEYLQVRLKGLKTPPPQLVRIGASRQNEQFRWLNPVSGGVYNRHSSENPVNASCHKPNGQYTHEGYNLEKLMLRFYGHNCHSNSCYCVPEK